LLLSLFELISFFFSHLSKPNSTTNALQFGTLKISGYLRGNKLNANNILHIVGYGDSQVLKITGGTDPYACRNTQHINIKKKKNSNEMNAGNFLYQIAFIITYNMI
jgi:hypothetical protein